MENVYYPLTIREIAPSSSKAGGFFEEAEAAGTMVAAATTALDEPAKESEPSGATETGEGLGLEVPLRAVESMAEAQAPHAKEPTFLVEPLQAVPLGEGSKDLEIISARLSEDGDKTKSKV